MSNIPQTEIDDVNQKLNKQNALKAAIASSIWSVVILLVWYLAVQMYEQLGLLFVILSGAAIGGLVRFYGKGYIPVFSLIAFIVHALLVLAALLLNIILTTGVYWLVLLLGLYLVSAYLAVFLARIQIPFQQHKVFFQLCELQQHSSSLALKNRCFVSVPIAIFLSSILLTASTIALFIVKESSIVVRQIEQNQKAEQSFEDRAIDVSVQSLQNFSTKEALLHAHAYYSGVLHNEYGYALGRYPSSKYKTKTILSFLSEQRKDPRATFVLGILSIENNGLKLIKQASEQGDVYAKIYQAVQFACNGSPKMSADFLGRLQKTSRERHATDLITSILYNGPSESCSNRQLNEFVLKHVTSY